MNGQNDIEELAKEIGRQCGRIADGLFLIFVALSVIIGIVFAIGIQLPHA